MGMITDFLDRMFEASWDRAKQRQKRREEVREITTSSLAVSDSPSPHSMNRTFTITEAMNGSYITFTKRKYNPNGPDDFRHEVYLVQPGESLVDAISTVLVLTEK